MRFPLNAYSLFPLNCVVELRRAQGLSLFCQAPKREGVSLSSALILLKIRRLKRDGGIQHFRN